MSEQRESTDRWIVGRTKFREHMTVESAIREAERLAKKHGDEGTEFRIYRVKTTLHASNAGPIIEAAEQLVAAWRKPGPDGAVEGAAAFERLAAFFEPRHAEAAE